MKPYNLRLQGLWVEYYKPVRNLIIVEASDVYRVTTANYQIDEWVNVDQFPIQHWNEYCYSPNMHSLSKHLNFHLLYVHQLRMHYVFQDSNFKVYYIYHGKFGGPFQAHFPVTFFADRLIYTGFSYSLEEAEGRGFQNYESKQTVCLW